MTINIGKDDPLHDTDEAVERAARVLGERGVFPEAYAFSDYHMDAVRAALAAADGGEVERRELGNRMAAECITSDNGMTAYLPIDLARDIFAALHADKKPQ